MNIYLLVGFFGTFKENKLLATLPKWGPSFSVSVDVKFNSWVKKVTPKARWIQMIHFIESSKDKGKRACCEGGTMVPAVKIYKRGGKHLEFSMGLGKKGFGDRSFKIKKGKWYSILISQKLVDGKVGTSNEDSYVTHFLNSVLV